MTSKRRAKKKPDSPSSTSSSSSSGNSTEERITSSSTKTSSSSSSIIKTRPDQEKKEIVNDYRNSQDSEMKNKTIIPFITPQHIKREIGLMKVNGLVNDLDESFSENSTLFGKEIVSRKRSIVTLLQHKDEDFKNLLLLKQSNNPSLNETSRLTGSKKRKQTRPVQAPVHSQYTNEMPSRIEILKQLSLLNSK